jgi:hypothetical protein
MPLAKKSPSKGQDKNLKKRSPSKTSAAKALKAVEKTVAKAGKKVESKKKDSGEILVTPECPECAENRFCQYLVPTKERCFQCSFCNHCCEKADVVLRRVSKSGASSGVVEVTCIRCLG